MMISLDEIKDLITEMIIHNAPYTDIKKVITHSIAVLDYEKHKKIAELSEMENDIQELIAVYNPYKKDIR